MGKEADLLFTVPVGTYFWTLEEHENMILALFFLIIHHMNWRRPWTIKVSEWESGTSGSVYTNLKRGCDSQEPFLVEGEMNKVSEGASKKSGDILRKFLHRARAIPSM